MFPMLNFTPALQCLLPHPSTPGSAGGEWRGYGQYWAPVWVPHGLQLPWGELCPGLGFPWATAPSGDSHLLWLAHR